ncbi:hypothetical protein I4F81_000196 [Pyropia yezoensis]|uniref:Uncharacterized protein n=1 Tax=Pyropia yezoensis TaxID=2788 RepID=A0ACC3BI47_PYRYE|nr:hypothetical protein I4F81_000196 [Neopyropia yezoensis]|eukprot:contig_13458_g3223
MVTLGARLRPRRRGTGLLLRLALALVAAAVAAASAAALNFKVQPNDELCFHEITHKGNKVLAFFDVVSWGYGAYVTLEVTAPSGKQLQSFVSESEGRVDFVAAEDGEYNFCFKNAYSETELSFWINTETDIGLSDVAKEEHVSDLVYSVERLNSMVNAAKVDLESFKAREARHRRTANSNRRRVTFWAVTECLLVLAVAVAQVVRIRNFFEFKRIV